MNAVSLGRSDPPRETPLASIDQRFGSHRGRHELFRDRVQSTVSDLLGSRELTLPLDALSPHVVIRQRGPVAALAAGAALGVVSWLLPGVHIGLAAGALLLGALLWWLGRTQYVVFPGQILDLELFRDRPDAATARRFVSQVVKQIETWQREVRQLEQQRESERQLDRVGELLLFRDLYAEGIIDRAEMRQAAEILARKRQGRIGFR
ncbi:MAG TPA: hypothetical protein VFD43_13230 [Planctomycetota bacterium]|nr:hypothetical protein [Planctomycetota bacterium]